MLAAVAGASSPLLRQWSVLVAALLPGAVIVLVGPLMVPQLSQPWRQPAATLVWALVLAAALAVAAGRSARAAALTGGLGALAACWSALSLTVAPHASRLGLDTRYAPLWYPASIMDPAGIPIGPVAPDPNLCVTGDDPCTRNLPASFQLLDFIEGYPTALTSITLYVAAYVLAAAYRPAVEPVPAAAA